VAHGFAQYPVDAWAVGVTSRLAGHHDADADGARRLLPIGNYIGHRRVRGVDRFDEAKTTRMGIAHLDRI